MINRAVITILLFSSVALLCFSQGNPDDEKLRDAVRQYRQAEVSIPDPGPAAVAELSKNVSISTIRYKKVFIVLSPLTVEWFIGREYQYTLLERSESKGMTTPGSMLQAMQWEAYPTYTQYDSIMRFLASQYPALCRLDTIGTSIRGRLVLALKLSDNCNLDEPEPKVFYSSTIHGDETGGFVLMLRLADYLIQNYDKDPRVKNLLDNLEIWINPLANPDGTYNNGDVISNPVRNNAANYDLNRNFPDPVTPNTVRQKETLDMMKFLENHRFVLSANFHSGEEVVNYPWDRWSRDHADRSWFGAVSRAYADTVHLYAPPGYMTYLDNGVTRGYDWYPVYGGRQDYVTYELQGRELTIELDNDYITPPSELNALWEYNKRSLLGYLENATRGINGVVKDAVTGEPVPAMIFIDSHDIDNSQVYADTLTGRFVRLLSPGTWDLTFTAQGYREAVLRNLTLNMLEGITVIVDMDPEPDTVDTVKQEDPLLYPNPGSQFINALLPGSLTGEVKITVFNNTGMKMEERYVTVFSGEPVILDIGNLARGVYTVVFSSRSTGLSFRSRFIVVRGS